MPDEKVELSKLIRRLSRGITYAAPAIALIGGAAAVHSVVSDVTSERGYLMSAAGAAEAEAEGAPKGRGY